MSIVKISLAILLLSVSFISGVIYSKYDLLERGAFELDRPLALASKSSSGILPKGTVLYPYSDGPSISTYVVFVNTKSLNALKPVKFEHKFTVSPVEAYDQK